MTETKREIAPSDEHSVLHSSELDKRKQGLRNWIDHKVLTPNHTSDLDLTGSFTDLPTREKTNILYEKLMAYTLTDRIIREEKKKPPVAINRSQKDLFEDDQKKTTEKEKFEPDPYLLAEIRELWNDPETQQTLLSRFSKSRLEAKLFRESEQGRDWRYINERIKETEEVYEAENRRLSLGQVKRPDHIEAGKGRLSTLAKSIIKLNHQKEDIFTLKDKDPISENTDLSAQLMYDQLMRYKEEGDHGFVMVPSRWEIHQQILDIANIGKYPLLIGPPGTGKTSQIEKAAIVLIDEPPVEVTCNSSSGVHDLLADKDINHGGSYRNYKGIGRAFTGYKDSEAATKECDHGRIVRLDELSELNLEKTLSVIKGAASKKPGDILHEEVPHPVLPGSFMIGASNEPIDDERLDREFGKVSVPYFTQTVKNPELYEFMLSRLLKHGSLNVAEEELAPAYDEEHAANGQSLDTFKDGAKVILRHSLIEDQTNTKHGTLYRLAFAIRALQDAYIHGSRYNEKHMAKTALYYDFDTNNNIRINGYNPDIENQQSFTGDTLTLSAGSSTLTVRTINKWMEGFLNRRHSLNPRDHTKTLTEWIQTQLKNHISQASSEDREKIEAIFNHFHLFDTPPILKDSKPLTPKEIGYLTPRVPRPVLTREVKQDEKPPSITPVTREYDDIKCMLADGKSISVRPDPLEINKDGKTIKLKTGRRFRIGQNKFRFIGLSPGEEPVIRIDTGHSDEALHRIISIQQLQQEVDFKNNIEDSKDLFGDKFLGPEAIRKTFGLEMPEHEIPDAIYDPFTREELTQKDLEIAHDLGMFLILRTDKLFKGKTIFGNPKTTPLTPRNMQQILQPQFDKGKKGKIFPDTAWYENENFFKKDTPQTRWALVSGLFPGSLSQNYLEQTQTLADFYTDKIYNGSPPSNYQQALDEFSKEKTGIAALLTSNWKDASDRLVRLRLNQLARPAFAEVIYDTLMNFQNNNDRLLTGKYIWTSSLSSDGRVVSAGLFDGAGFDVNDWVPGISNSSVGVWTQR